jgi:hypothetical protein
VGLADKFTGLLIKQVLSIGYTKEKPGVNQDKSLMGLARRSVQAFQAAHARRVQAKFFLPNRQALIQNDQAPMVLD